MPVQKDKLRSRQESTLIPKGKKKVSQVKSFATIKRTKETKLHQYDSKNTLALVPDNKMIPSTTNDNQRKNRMKKLLQKQVTRNLASIPHLRSRTGLKSVSKEVPAEKTEAEKPLQLGVSSIDSKLKQKVDKTDSKIFENPKHAIPENSYSFQSNSSEEMRDPKRLHEIQEIPKPIENGADFHGSFNTSQLITKKRDEIDDIQELVRGQTGLSKDLLTKENGPLAYFKTPEILCFGQNQFTLSYNVAEDKWFRKEYNHEKSEFIGNLKYLSVCQLDKPNCFLATGGCSTVTNEATDSCFYVEFPHTYTTTQKIVGHFREALIQRRYGHCSIYLNGYVLVIGGFMMSDNIGTTPITLTSCEKYHPVENIWTEAAELQTARAYPGFCKYGHFVYIFGGFENFSLLDSFERYDALVDLWEEITLKLPFRVAKMGVGVLEENRSILICGGLYSDEDDNFSYINNVYKLDLKTERWTKLASMGVTIGVKGVAGYFIHDYKE